MIQRRESGVAVVERRLGETPWVVVRGERVAAFRALGEYASDRITEAVATVPDLATQRRRLADPAVARQYAAVAAATESEYPREWAELAALAAGSGADLDDLLLLNLRGDLGVDDGTGCSDLGYVAAGRGFVAHNEDGAAAQRGRCLLLTLLIDGDVPVTCWWCPGFVPANTFVVTGHGLVWGIDHIGVRQPAAAPGRHFVARAAQHQPTHADVVRHLTTSRAAGGFAYTVGTIGHPAVTQVETAAGRSHARAVRPDSPLCWHTNHLLDLPSTMDKSYPNSLDRARFLRGLRVPEAPGTDWFLSVLAGASLPNGVRRDDNGVATLATFVVDLAKETATIQPADTRPLTVPVADLLR
jgi:acyl-CoA:6-aminopenicillanic acid acyl transferase